MVSYLSENREGEGVEIASRNLWSTPHIDRCIQNSYLSCRRVRADHPVELPAADGGVEAGPGAGDRQHHHHEAGRADAAHRVVRRAAHQGNIRSNLAYCQQLCLKTTDTLARDTYRWHVNISGDAMTTLCFTR